MTYRQMSYAYRQAQTQQDNGGNLPSYICRLVVVDHVYSPFAVDYVHLVVENFRLAALSGLNQVLIKNLKDVLADLRKLGLNLLTVFLDQADLTLVALGFLFLLN